MTLVGNALLLGYAFAVVQRRGQIWGQNESRKDRREYAERRELRQVLLLAGPLDVRLDAGDISETLGDWDRRIETLARSKADIAQICTLDLSISKNMQEKNGIFANAGLMDAFELRLPFARLFPVSKPMTFAIKYRRLAYRKWRHPYYHTLRANLMSKMAGQHSKVSSVLKFFLQGRGWVKRWAVSEP